MPNSQPNDDFQLSLQVQNFIVDNQDIVSSQSDTKNHVRDR